jgi:hypothetical protein
MDSRGCPKSKKDDAVTCGKAEKSSGGSRMGADANRVSIPNPPIAKVSPLPSAPSNHGPFADNFSQCANLSLNVCSQSRPRGVAFRSTLPHHPAQVPRFQELGFQVPQNKRITAEPCSQRVENRQFGLKHTGGDAPRSPARKDFMAGGPGDGWPMCSSINLGMGGGRPRACPELAEGSRFWNLG